jgi:hypothetical protein
MKVKKSKQRKTHIDQRKLKVLEQTRWLELKAKLVKEAQKEWDYIAYDCLQVCTNKSCSAEEAQEAVGDRVESKEFWNLTHDQQEEILKEAIPNSQCI